MSNKIVAFFFLLMAGAASALGKTGTDPGAPAGVGDFVAGNAAVAAEVNKQINILYKALNDGTNSINIDGWTNGSGNLGYTGGNLGVGIASPLAKFQVNGGSAITLAGATGFGVFGATTGNHIAVDSTQIQAKSNATMTANLAINPFGGNVNFGGGMINGTNMSLTSSDGNWNASFINASSGGRGAYVAGGNGGAAAFQVDNYNATATLLRIHGNGNVGVGTASPGVKLDVSGDVQASGTLAIGGSRPASTTNGRTYVVQGGAIPNTNFSQNSVSSLLNTFASGGNGGFSFDRYIDGAYVHTNMFLLAGGDVRIGGIVTGGGNTNTGCIRSADNTIITGSCSSDRRLKKNIRDLDPVLAKIIALRPVSYLWSVETLDDQKMPTGPQIGLIAQEAEKVFPDLVVQGRDGYKRVSYSAHLQVYLIQAFKELKTEKDTQILTLQRGAQQLEKRAIEAEQKHAALLKYVQQEKTQTQARAAKLERLLAEESQARKQQELRLARLEQMLQKQVVARR